VNESNPRKSWRARYRPRRIVLRDGRGVLLRAIDSGDRGELAQAFERLSAESRYLRFMHHKTELSDEELSRSTTPLSGREFVFVATVAATDGYDIVGAARYVQSASGADRCEFGITIADAWQGSGLATRMMQSLMRRARFDGYRAMEGDVLSGNGAMLALARRLKFSCRSRSDDAALVLVERVL
jgi:RimJ/RimL family protein N-acetyltransferase